MLLAGLLLLGVHGAAGYRASEGDYMVPESLAQRRQLFRQLGVVGKKRLEGAKCETEVPGGVTTVVMLSGTGEGKSTTTCVISGNPVLAHVAAEGKADSETSESCIHKASWFFPYDHSEPLYLVDTPGFGDTRGQKVIKENNDDIVDTLKRAGEAHAILWVLNSENPKVNEGRQDAFRFVRSYFGNKIYEHIVFVYTRYSWNKRRGPRYVRGEARKEALMKQHRNTMAALLQQVETEFWPGGIVGQDVNDTIMHLPCFAFNTHSMDVDEEGESLTFADNDLGDSYNDDDPDGFGGVFNPETFPEAARPNSATQLLDLKAKVLAIAAEPPLDLRHLRPFQDGCEAACKDTTKTDPVLFGQHVTDCVEGQQYKLLKDEVAPCVNRLPDGPLFAAFSIVAYTGGRGPAGSSLRAEAMKELGIPDSDRETAEAFASFGAYVACRGAGPAQSDVAALAESLSTCLGGIAAGHGTPAPVKDMKERFFGEAARSDVSPAYIDRLVSAVRKLPGRESLTVLEHMDFFASLIQRKVKFPIRGPSNFDLGDASVTLTASTLLESVVEGAVYKQHALRLLREQGWIKDVSLYASDGTVITDDIGMVTEIGNIFAEEPSPSVKLTARVAWVPGSPPHRLDPRLLKACLDHDDLPAAAALVRDRVTHPGMLVFTADPEQVMPSTAKHGHVFSDVVALRGAEVEAFRDMTSDDRQRLTVGVEELIRESGVLKGVYLGQDFELKPLDLVQITRVPDTELVRKLVMPTLPPRRSEGTAYRSDRAAQALRKGWKSFPGAPWAHRASNDPAAPDPAVNTAVEASSTMDEAARIAGGAGSFNALKMSAHTMATVNLEPENFRLAAAFVAQAARILHRDAARWPEDIESLFNAYGTHYCSSVEMGGVYLAEAKLDTWGSLTDTEAENALSECLSAGSGRSQPCTITKSCVAKADKCPASDGAFASGLRENGGSWAAIDRRWTGCTPVWEKLREPEYRAELLQAAGKPPPGRAAPDLSTVQALLIKMYRVWSLRALGLPKLCERVLGDAAPECGEDLLLGGASVSHWELLKRVRARAGELLEFNRKCSAKEWCNHVQGKGRCKMKGRAMTCECKPTFRGEFCGEKIPEKVCTKWRDTHCTAHPLEWYQPGCSTLWDHQYRYASWEYCTTHLSGYHICKKTYMCQPNTEGHDCCGALGPGERWNKR